MSDFNSSKTVRFLLLWRFILTNEMEVKLGTYRHFKGKLYRVLSVARHSEDPTQEFVVYQALYDSEEFGNNAIWVRPKAMFLETVERDGKVVKRFERISE